VAVLSAAAFASAASAEPLSKKTEIDFFRDIPSRNLKGLATRSDGRLVAGPVLVELSGQAPADMLWCLEPAGEPNRWLVGSGPDGRVFEVTVDSPGARFETREVVKLDDPQVFAIKRLSDGAFLAGTSPKGALYLVRAGQVAARTLLPVDSIFDLLLLDSRTALAATGNPGRIFRIDLEKFAAAGILAEKVTDREKLAERGLSVFGEIRDRNVRRIAALPDGRIAAGSSPRGNIYLFPSPAALPTDPPPAAPAAPVILQENRDAEVTDLLPQIDGDLLATVVFSATSGESRITPPPPPPTKTGTEVREPPPPPAQPERFGGRSALLRFPANGFAETLSARANTAFYRIARHGETLILAGGEQGELVGYDPKTRLALTYSGSISAQLNAIVPAGSTGLVPDQFLVLRNNAPGFALLDFKKAGKREAESRRLDLATPALLGALRFNRLRNLTDANLTLELRTSHGNDEVEGWSPWSRLAPSPDGGWRSDGLRGRSLRLRLALDNAADFELDRVTVFALPQNRRPQLQDYRALRPGFGLVPANEPPPPTSVTLNQFIQGQKDEDRRRSTFLNSQVVPSPGTQVVLWTVNDPDGDTVLCTFSLRREGTEEWTDIVTATRETFAQFNTAHLPEGVYFTRVVASETAPRPAAERLSQTFETDDLIVDHTPPEILEASARRSGESLVVTVRGRDRLSLLEGIEVVFTNNVRESVEQPLDGVRDGREETFVLEVPLARVSNATSLEVTLSDLAGNGVARRLTW
jgi:hypothetical protein